MKTLLATLLFTFSSVLHASDCKVHMETEFLEEVPSSTQKLIAQKLRAKGYSLVSSAQEADFQLILGEGEMCFEDGAKGPADYAVIMGTMTTLSTGDSVDLSGDAVAFLPRTFRSHSQFVNRALIRALKDVPVCRPSK